MTLPIQQRGFSILELLIALGLGLMLTAGVVIVFVQNHRSAVQDEEIARVLENGRYLVRILSREMAMSGYWGKFLDVGTTINDASVLIGQDCGDGVNPWTMELNAIQFLDNVTTVTTAATFECLPSANIVVGSDIVAIKRVSDFETADASLQTNQIYMRTNAVAATMFLGGAAGTPPAMAGTVVNWSYRPQIYFLRNYSFNPADGIPSLCRGFLDNSSPPDMITECLIEGVENLQIEFGVDDDDDFIADYYTGSPTAAELFDSVSCRIHVLLRSLKPIPSYINDKAYSMGSVNIAAANDGYFRRVFSTTVLLRNPANLAGLGS